MATRFCFCFSSGPELLGEYNSSDCAVACDEPYQDLGCGGINPDNLVQLYSYYTQNGASVSNGSSLANSTVSNLLSSGTSLPSIFTAPTVSGPGINVTATSHSPRESSGVKSTGGSIPGSPPLTGFSTSNVSIGSAAVANPTAASLNPETGFLTGGAPLTTSSAGSVPTGPAGTSATADAGTDALRNAGQGNIGGEGTTPQADGTITTTTTSTISTTATTTIGAAAAAVTTIAVEYGEEFWVSVASLVQTAGDLFENYTLSSSPSGAGGAAEDVDDVTIWWDRPDLQFGGVIDTGPGAPRPAAWFIHATMRRAGEEDVYYSFVIEVDVAGTYDGTGASGAAGATGLPSGAVSVSQVVSPTRIPSSSQAPPYQSALTPEGTSFYHVASPPRAAPPSETAPVTETSSAAVDSAGLVTPKLTWSSSSPSTPSNTMFLNSTLSSTAFASSSAAPNNPYDVASGKNFSISLAEVSGNPNDKFVSFVASTSPAGYDTSWIMYDTATDTFHGQVPNGFPNVTVLLKIMVQRTSSEKRRQGGKRQDETAYSIVFGLSIKGSSSGAGSVSPAPSSRLALAGGGALFSWTPSVALSSAPPLAAVGSGAADKTASEPSAEVAGLQAIQNAAIVPDSLSDSGLSPDISETATLWDITTSWTTGTSEDDGVATPAVPAGAAGFLEAYAPSVESSTFEEVTGEGSMKTASVPAATVTQSEEITAGPLTTVVVTTCDTDLDDPLITAGASISWASGGTASGGTGVGSQTPAPASWLPVTAGAVVRDGKNQLESIAFMFLGAALGALLLA